MIMEIGIGRSAIIRDRIGVGIGERCD